VIKIIYENLAINIFGRVFGLSTTNITRPFTKKFFPYKTNVSKMFVDLLLLLLLHFDVKICLDLCLVILIILKNDLLFSLHVMLMLLWQTQGIVVVVVVVWFASFGTRRSWV
jgi:hypothetical protein